MGLLDAIEKLINERGSAAIMRERLALIREQAQVLEKQIAQLQQENAALKDRVSDLERQVSSAAASAEFIECQGALFKRKPTGGYHLAVYCPRCRGPMISLEDEIPFHCGPCGVSVNFTGRNLRSVMAELP